MVTIKTSSPEETLAIGRELAKLTSPGDVICLAGDLGAGKTLLVQGMAQALGVQDKVVSPTFTIMNVYSGPITIYHFDLYRLEQAAELRDIGFDEYLGGDGVAIIEWPDKFPDDLPKEKLWIKITAGPGSDDRLLTIECQGPRYQKFCKELK